MEPPSNRNIVQLIRVSTTSIGQTLTQSRPGNYKLLRNYKSCNELNRFEVKSRDFITIIIVDRPPQILLIILKCIRIKDRAHSPLLTLDE